MNKAIDKVVNFSKFKIPRHLAIIMDGNGRWAKMRHFPRTYGHRQAEKAIRCSVEYCISKGVEALTFFVFSTENWQRPDDEVNFLMNLLQEFLQKSKNLLHKNKVKLLWLGSRKNVPTNVKLLFEQLISETMNYDKMTLCLAVDYGSKDEIILATKEICTKLINHQIEIKDINEQLLEKELFTSELPPLDLLIRTSGEYRLSNFLLWQAAYSELYFCETLWPDFSEIDLDLAFASYQSRSRRWGKVGSF